MLTGCVPDYGRSCEITVDNCFLTFLGGGGGFCEKASFTASAADSGSLLSPFFESVSERTTKK